MVILVPKPKRLSKLPKHVFGDAVKWTLIPAKIILDGLSLWPERQDKTTRLLSLLCLASIIFAVFGHLHYLSQNAPDPASAALSAIISIACIEGIARQVFLIYHSDRLVNLLQIVYWEFWPSVLAEEELRVKLSQKCRRLILYCLVYTCSAFLCVMQLIVVALVSGGGNLPSHATYPFDWRQSPLNEFLFVWHSFVGQAVAFIICGTDLLFVSLLWNCVAQFVILQERLRRSFVKNVLEGGDGLQVLAQCIDYHNKLIHTCKEIEDIFTYFNLLQLLANVGTVCMSCFVATIMPQEIGMCGTYLAAHLAQLFIYCYMGTQLISESTALADSVFHCGWHLSDKTEELTKPLIILMLRCQKQQCLTAGGFVVLDLRCFIKVVQRAFSIYTLLNSLMEKEN